MTFGAVNFDCRAGRFHRKVDGLVGIMSETDWEFHKDYLTEERVLRRLRSIKTQLASTGEMLYKFGVQENKNALQSHGNQMVGAARIAQTWIDGILEESNENGDSCGK